MNFLVIAACAGLAPMTAEAALPAGFEVETIASGLELPGSLAFAADGRIFIGEKSGVIRVIKNGTLLPTPVVTLTDVNAYGDRGLLSITLDPNFSSNGYIYALYTYENTPGANYAGEKTGRLARLKVVGDTADESTKTVILGTVGGTLAAPSCEDYATTSDCIPSDSPSHSTGALRFGPDGKLYVTLGDGAHFDYVDPRAMRAQNLDSLGGKLLRINPDGTAPSDNPFYTGNPNDNRSKVYAYGLRNAFRINFRPSNNSLYAGDVGWSSWEEVDKIVRGGNYGWPCREGNFATTGYNCSVANRIDPLYAYAHDSNGAGAVVAGDFATSYPAAYANSFFIGDYAQNWIKLVNVDANDNLLSVQDFMTGADGAMGPVALDRGPDGNIYYIAIYAGEIRRIVYTSGNRQPIAQIGATPTNGTAPLLVNFSSAGSSDPDGDALSFLWNFGDGATSTAANAAHTYPSNGTYTATLTVRDGKGGVNTKSVAITVGNRAPTAVISSPENGSLYKAGNTISVSGFGTDPEDGTITAAANLTWTIILHHNTHIHILETLSGANASFVAPDHAGETDIYTEVQLTATDAGGLTNTRSINLYLDNNVGTGGNLIQNHSLENAIPGAPDAPQNWLRGGWGQNAFTHTYPVAGVDGASAGKVAILSYTSGDAKWFHDPVTVSPNTTYTFSGYYQSNVPVQVVAQFGYGDGTYTYPTLGAELPAATAWTRVERTFTTPANAQTGVVAILLNRVGELTIDNFSIVRGDGTGDTTPPAVSLTAPLTGSTVSGTVSMSATSSDASGLKEVRFAVDGAVVNTVSIFADTKPPFTFGWNSASVANGSHTLSAIAEDTAGNVATSSITVTVSNLASSTNLIANPSVETEGTGGRPASWNQGKWGTNATTFSYPVAGYDGAKAMRISVTSYTSGDAKWFFQQVPVTGGEQYVFTDRYMSNTTSHVTLYYQLQDGTFRYPDIATNLAATSTWATLTRTFTIPTNYPSPVVSVSAFHLIKSVGWLETDAYELRKVSTSTPPADTTAPTVSISAPAANATLSGTTTISATAADNIGVSDVRFYIDNALAHSDASAPYSFAWDSRTVGNGGHSVFAVARDAAGNAATSSPVSFTVNNIVTPPATTTNLIANGSFENGTTGNPTGWKRGGWGTNTVQYNYPVTGRDGNRAAEVNVTAYTDGDIKWFPDDIPMERGKVYTYSSWYRSNTISDVIGRYTLADGSYHYFGVIKEIAPSATWKQFSASFIPPDNAVSFTPLHLISSVGFLTTDDVSLTVTGTGTSTNDTIAPVVEILTPANNATVSGVVNVTASSTDNIGVTYVMYAIDGTPVTGNEITTAPYSFAWDSRTVGNGTHTIKATTHDAVGNNSTHTITVTVNNTAGPDTTAPTVAFTSPANNAFVSGTTTVSVQATDNVGVADVRFYVGTTLVNTDTTAPYSFDWNTRSVRSDNHELRAIARDAAGNESTAYLNVIVQNSNAPLVALTAPSANAILSGTVTVSASTTDRSGSGINSVYFFTLENGTRSAGGQDSSAPYAAQWNTTLRADGAYNLVAIAIDNAGNRSTSTPVTVTINNASTTNMIANGSLESGSAAPTDWFQGNWGANTVAWSYPVSGLNGGKAAKVAMTSYVDGDAKWFFKPVTVTGGATYAYSSNYTSNIATTLTARYTMPGGSFAYVDLGTVSASASWQKFERAITVPATATEFTVFHRINGVGELTVDDFSLVAQ